MSTEEDRLDDLLRSLDAADPELDELARRRGDAALNRILTTDSAPMESAPIESARTELAPAGAAPTSPARRWRWLTLVAAAAIVAVVATVWSGLGQRGPAYASWTPKPTPVTGELRQQTTEACIKQLADSERRHPVGVPHAPIAKAETARVLIAEQRGDYVFIALTTDSGADWTCLFEAARPEQPVTAGGGMPTDSTPAEPPLAPDELRLRGSGSSSGPEGGFASAQGKVGSEVSQVTIHNGGQQIEASVNDGFFAAWWPITSADPTAIDDLSFDVTLADGRVLTGVDDGMMAPKPGPREVGRVSVEAGTDDKATVAGLAGSEVTAVTVHIGDRALPAQLADGVFRVSWDLPKGTHDPGVFPEDLRFTLTLTDGTVLPKVKALQR